MVGGPPAPPTARGAAQPADPTSPIDDRPNFEVEVFRDRHDDEILARMERNSERLATVCARGRGEEMSKAGLLWLCPSCLRYTTPGKKQKAAGYKAKKCPHCSFFLEQDGVQIDHLVRESLTTPISTRAQAPFIDGDDINRRYRLVAPQKYMRLDVPDWPYKPAELYSGDKLLIRQAGVGLVATVDRTGARCPQSVYMYRLRPEWAARGYTHEFVLGALLSRTAAYYIFKRFAETDPAKAHPKLTHERVPTSRCPRCHPTRERNTQRSRQ